MSSTNFSSGVTITSLWLTDVNTLVWGVFAGANTASSARVALNISATGADTTYAFRANNLSDLVSTSTARTNLGAAAAGLATASGLTINTARLLGRTTASVGALEEVTVGTGLTFSSDTLSVTQPAAAPTPITNSLGSDVNISSANTFFDGPSVAQGAIGTWFVSGSVTLLDTTNSVFVIKLWDGTNVIATTIQSGFANDLFCISLSGVSVNNPPGNLRISAENTTTTTGKIKFNGSGLSKDSTITAYRIA